MDYFGRILSLAALAPLSTLVALAPVHDARACSTGEDPSPCELAGAVVAIRLQHDVVAPDGVIVLGVFGGDDGSEILEHLSVTVRAGGMELPGSIELADGVDSMVVWRPDDSFPAGSSITVEAMVDNAALTSDAECEPVQLDGVRVELSVSTDALPALSLPEIVFETQYRFTPLLSFDDVVCCDGAYPQDESGDCYEVPVWPQNVGHCAAPTGSGAALGLFSLQEDLPPEVAASLLFELVEDGEVVERSPGAEVAEHESLGGWNDAEVVMHLRVRSLATGDVVESDAFVADGGGEGPLGSGIPNAQFDAELSQMCEERPYRCEHGGPLDGWDEESCTPWDGDWNPEGGSSSGSDGDVDGDTDSAGQDSDSGGGCSVAHPTYAGGWALVLGFLALFGRRRRR